MSAINHFQTYSQRENHVTNNTMLMLRYVYRKSPWLLEQVLQALLEDDEIEIGPRFAQQVGAAHSTPDAVLMQRPLNIYLEAKRGDWLYDDQLERHMRSISARRHPENSAFLIGLTSNSIESNEEWQRVARQRGVILITATYHDLLDALDAVCAKDVELAEVLEDYKTFINGENLLPAQYRWLVAFLCGQSWRDSALHGVHHEPASRNPKWTRARFVGLYHNKCISHVGRLEAVVICSKEDGTVNFGPAEFGTLTDAHRHRIEANMTSAEKYFPGFSAYPHRFYLVDGFVETNLRKASSGGMMNHRYFDIGQLAKVDKVPLDASSAEVAEMLDGKEFS